MSVKSPNISQPIIQCQYSICCKGLFVLKIKEDAQVTMTARIDTIVISRLESA